MNPELNKLYHQIILAHNDRPFHFVKKEEVPFSVEANNPFCGDRFNLFLDIADDKIVQAHFHGFGCIISKASTSILTQQIEGKTVEEARVLCHAFLQYVEGHNRDEVPEDYFTAFSAVDEFPARKDCAILAWEALYKALTNLKTP